MPTQNVSGDDRRAAPNNVAANCDETRVSPCLPSRTSGPCLVSSANH